MFVAYSRQGEVISTPGVAFSELVNHTPQPVDVSISLDGDSLSETVPVFARLREMHQD